ncbi:serine protease, subtilase family [Candidatus Scalindua japonica]|uniref:Serine protease, subtilase family n=1 Tax=Candidatus Scalindua japonica TaxID=1284222 RepID=A0A286TX04_9BACT|nr:S8 family peptidase [Candidatus Scalindua japonica]GAX60406.1 serine protease, subtilase family [Candidatus Scalindua japonica]
MLTLLNTIYKRNVFIAATLFFICLLLNVSFADLSDSTSSHKSESCIDFNPDRIIVKFKGEVAGISAGGVIENAGINILKTFNCTGVCVLELVDKQKSVKEICDQLNQSGMVEYAEPDYIVHADAIPNDPRFPDLWGLNNIGQSGGSPNADIDAPEAWNSETGSNSVIVAVIDTGVDYNHEDLVGNMWINPGETPGNGIDDDGNGYIDDIHGINSILGTGDSMDNSNHGTHVAGTIGAKGNNGIGVAGVNWDIKIIGCKFLNSFGIGSTSDAIECLEYLIWLKNNGIDVKLSNNSWGGGGFSQGLHDAIEAAGDAGILFCASAGNASNDNDTTPSYPSGYDLPNIIAVASTDRNDRLSSFSSYGATSVDLAAPGSSILSTTPGNTYSTFSGTSMSAPHVGGACALVWAQNPSYSYLDVKETILSTVDVLQNLTGKTLTDGRLNINNAINCDAGNPQLTSSLQNGFEVTVGEDVIVKTKLVACALLKGAAVTATFGSTGGQINLLDNGVAPDVTANDGVYTGTWVPSSVTALTVTIDAVHNTNNYQLLINGDVMSFDGYHYDDTVVFNWIDISGTGTPVPLGDDDFAHFQIPFPIAFYGTGINSQAIYNNISIGSNGQIYFDNNSFGNQYSNSTLPYSNTSVPFIALFWDDLNPSGSNMVFWEVRGTAPNRQLIVQYNQVPHYNRVGAATFEIVFYENSENILMQYLDVDFGNANYNNGSSATIGMQRDQQFAQQYSFNQPSLQNDMAILWYQTGQIPPSVKIKVNGNDDLVSVSPNDNVTYSLSIDAGDSLGLPVELWLGVMSPYGTFRILSGIDIPLINLSDTNLFTFPLPAGIWAWFIIIDDKPDDVLDLKWYDWAVVLSLPN